MITLACILCTTPEAFKIHDAQSLINRVVQTQCFTNEMYAQGVSDNWIDAIRSAKHRLPIYYFHSDETETELDEYTVGYMNPGSDNIYLNRKFHNSFSRCQTGSNITHELTHVIGFRHKRDVAYAANYAFEACCTE